MDKGITEANDKEGGPTSEKWPMREGRISTIRILAEQGHSVPVAWPHIVGDLCRTAWYQSGAKDRVFHEVDQLLGEAQGGKRSKLAEFAMNLEDALMEPIMEAVEYGAALGYALARTYPDSLETWDGWLEQAIDYSGVREYPEVVEGSDEEDLDMVRRAAGQAG